MILGTDFSFDISYERIIVPMRHFSKSLNESYSLPTLVHPFPFDFIIFRLYDLEADRNCKLNVRSMNASLNGIFLPLHH